LLTPLYASPAHFAPFVARTTAPPPVTLTQNSLIHLHLRSQDRPTAYFYLPHRGMLTRETWLT